MSYNQLTFDELPGAVSSLVTLVKELTLEIGELREFIHSHLSVQKSAAKFIGMTEACQILGKAQSTVYALAREGKIPAYKVPGEKEWRFMEHELVDFVRGHKRASTVLSFEEMQAQLSKGSKVRHSNFSKP